jgi:hypothetical protein
VVMDRVRHARPAARPTHLAAPRPAQLGPLHSARRRSGPLTSARSTWPQVDPAPSCLGSLGRANPTQPNPSDPARCTRLAPALVSQRQPPYPNE